MMVLVWKKARATRKTTLSIISRRTSAQFLSVTPAGRQQLSNFEDRPCTWKVNWRRGSPGPINIIQDFVDLINELRQNRCHCPIVEIREQLLEGLPGAPIVPLLQRVLLVIRLDSSMDFQRFVRRTTRSDLFSIIIGILQSFFFPLLMKFCR